MKKVLFLLTLIVILTISYFSIVITVGDGPKTNNNIDVITKKTTTLDMVMVGDMLLHSTVYNDAYKNGVYDFTSMFSMIKPIVKNYDLAFYNQETILGGTSIGLSNYPRFNSPQEVGDAMIDAGFNLVGLANNHVMDRGEIAINNSLNYWNSKTDVMTAGSYTSFAERDEVKIMTKNDITYTLLAYTKGTNGLPVPSGKEYLANVYDEALVKADVERARALVDVVMVSIHWGTEYTHTPNSFQEETAAYLASLGVDIVIGHHPHVIQPITKINNTIVIYSLGNFISGQKDFLRQLVGLMAGIKITKTVEGDTKTITIENTANELLYTYHNSSFHNFKVIPFSQIDSSYLSNYAEAYETFSEVVRKNDPTLIINPLKK